MRKSDDGLRSLIHRHLPPPKCLLDVEIGLTSRGVPDLHCMLSGVSVWVETKATDGWAVTLRPAQIGWMVTYHRHGGRALVAVRRRTASRARRSVPRGPGPSGPPTPTPADELWLLRGRHAPQLRAGGLRWALAQPPGPACPLLGRWPGGPGAWDWEAVRRLLRES